jgi:predicted phosphodiesterase
VRIAVVSDIHGNLRALEAVMKDVEHQSPDQIWCGGDLGWLGPRATECIELVRGAGWPTVKGNTDVWITGDPQTIEDEDARAETMAMAKAHAIDQDAARWLAGLPLGHSAPGSILMVHGTPDSPFTAPFPDSPPAEFAAYEGRAGLVLFGHVHLPFVRRLADGTVVANPGSVGLPVEGTDASYMVVDQHGPHWTIQHHHVEYDVEEVLAEARSFGGPAGERFCALLAGP